MTAVRHHPVRHMLELAADLKDGRYRPGTPCLFTVQKADGTARDLTVFPVRDRVVQRAILQVGQRITERTFMPSSFGFRPGRGVRLALAAVTAWVRAGFGFIVDADIRTCFDSIPRKLALDRAASALSDRRAVELLHCCVEMPQGAGRKDGLAQGSCLSPWLCNIYLHGFDASMHARHIPLVRYADDFVLFAASRAGAIDALQKARDWMDKNQLALHPEKTRLLEPHQVGRFLGTPLARPPLLLAN